ncbi:DUF3105 domain-containing protein [Polyangium spumosum]|uniref:DUF3105 domain-containing protein n=1 Tax=Polyangium spumosum TaxID=889282 RepID=A0A6N7PSN0_9BACT|nr:DUF3105 domain-containing protein [Polyangium spumosum]MRG93255.1 DUF3105 domain-containing protein [Polyangium spumosum]
MPSHLFSRDALACALVFVSLGSAGCGEDPPLGPTGPAETEVLTPDAPPLPGETECRVVKTTNIPVASANHVELCADVTYETNPPSGGDHWGQWAAFKKYTTPVPREMYVHDLEHGAVVLSYRCEDACPEVVAALEKVFDEAAADPLCLSGGAGPKARLVLTPDAELEAPIAAAAWGATYTATCIDTASLAAFVSEVYGKGPEATCFDGVDVEAAPPDCPAK